MKLTFVGAALLISVLSTDAQGYSESQDYIVSANYNPQLLDPEYPNSPYPPPDRFRPKKLIQLFSKFAKFRKKQCNRKRHWRRRQRYPGRLRSFSFDPSNSTTPPQVYFDPPQDFSGPPQGFSGSQGFSGPPQDFFGPPQVYVGVFQDFSGPPQGYPVAGTTQESSSFPAQPSGSAVPPSSGTPAPPASVSSGVKLPGNSTLPASGEPGSAAGSSGEETSASKGQEIKASQ